jgi:hypothetical protein
VSKSVNNLDQYRHVLNALLHVSNNYLDLNINTQQSRQTQISIVSKGWFFCWVSVSIDTPKPTQDTSSPNINRVFCPFFKWLRPGRLRRTFKKSWNFDNVLSLGLVSVSIDTGFLRVETWLILTFNPICLFNFSDDSGGLATRSVATQTSASEFLQIFLEDPFFTKTGRYSVKRNCIEGRKITKNDFECLESGKNEASLSSLLI